MRLTPFGIHGMKHGCLAGSELPDLYDQERGTMTSFHHENRMMLEELVIIA